MLTMLWIDYFRELDTTYPPFPSMLGWLWIDYFRELDTTLPPRGGWWRKLWIDYFRELDTTVRTPRPLVNSCGLITLGN